MHETYMKLSDLRHFPQDIISDQMKSTWPRSEINRFLYPHGHDISWIRTGFCVYRLANRIVTQNESSLILQGHPYRCKGIRHLGAFKIGAY